MRNYQQAYRNRQRRYEDQQRRLRQQRRVRRLQYQQQYYQRLRRDQQRLQQARYYDNLRNDYRYRRNGNYYYTSSYGAAMLKRAVNDGYDQGYRAGQSDKYDGWRNSPRDSYGYTDASYGYDSYYVSLNEYQYYFRQGFERGYRDGNFKIINTEDIQTADIICSELFCREFYLYSDSNKIVH